MYLTAPVSVRNFIVLVATVACASAQTYVRKSILPPGTWRSTTNILDDRRMVFTNQSIYQLMDWAYQIPPHHNGIQGGEAWTREERFDIAIQLPEEAYAPGVPFDRRGEIRQQLLRDVLRDHFHLRVSLEMKPVPVYVWRSAPELALATLTEADCLPDGANGCHNFTGGMGRGLRADAVQLTELAREVSRYMDRPIIDKTGLTALYRVDIPGWRPLTGPVKREGLDDPTRLSIFDVLAKVGLRLEVSREPLETVTIVSARRPLSTR